MKDVRDKIMAHYPLGTKMTGTVREQQPYGVWVTLDELPDIAALLEITRFEILETKPEHRIEFPHDYPPVGARIEARIAGWTDDQQGVRLTQLSHLR